MSNNYATVPLDKDEIGLLLSWMYRAQASGPAASALIRKLQGAKKYLRLCKAATLDADNLIEMTEEDATKLIESHQMVARVTSRDGESFMITAELRNDRINLDIISGRVTAAKIG